MIYKVYGYFDDDRNFLFDKVDMDFHITDLIEVMINSIEFMGMISYTSCAEPYIYIESEFKFKFEKEKREDIIATCKSYIRDEKLKEILQ